MIMVVCALSYPRGCLSTDQLVYRRATQTAETNVANETKYSKKSQLAGGKPVGYLQAQPKDL